MKKSYNGLRWTARIIGSISVIFTLVMLTIVFTVGLKALEDTPLSSFTPRIVISVTLWFVAAVALILAFWNEGLGGSISLFCNLGIAVFGLLNDKDPVTTVLSFLILSIPAFLYLSYWFAVRGNGGDPETANAI